MSSSSPGADRGAGTHPGAVRGPRALVLTAVPLALAVVGCSGSDDSEPPRQASDTASRPMVTAPPAAENHVFVMPDSVTDPDPGLTPPYSGLDAEQTDAVRHAWEQRADRLEEFRNHREKLDGRTCTAAEGAWVLLEAADARDGDPETLTIGVPPDGVTGQDAASGLGCTTDVVLEVDLSTGRVLAGVEAAEAIFGSEPDGAS